MTNKQKNRKILEQKILGVLFLALSVGIIVLASKGLSVEERDATAVLITLPVGVYLFVTKKIIIR